MRVGLTVSIIAHAAVLGFGFLAFPEGHPFEAANIEALPVDLVTSADVTDLLKGDKSSRILPEENPQPTPTVQAETPAKPAEKPAPKPVEATPPPPSNPPPEPQEKPPEPPPTPAPKPEDVAALLKPAAEVLPPAPKIPVEAPKPKPRPEPPKPVAQPKPEKPKPDKKPEFNPDDIAALLNKQTPTGGGDPKPAKEPQTLGSIDGHENAAMTQDLAAALSARLKSCWHPPAAVSGAAGLVVKVRFNLQPDLSLAGTPEIVEISMASDPLAQVAAEAAVRAVIQCAPTFGDILRPKDYALWRQITFNFDPAKMLGG